MKYVGWFLQVYVFKSQYIMCAEYF